MTQRLLTRWFLTSKERGNPSTRLDARHLGGAPWTEGNMVRPLIHGATYFAELHRRVSQMRDGDLLMFVDWRGDPDERLTGSPDTEVGKVFADAARRGVDVRGLVWRSHWDRLAFSAGENRRLGDEINDAGGQCLLDMRVRTGGELASRATGPWLSHSHSASPRNTRSARSSRMRSASARRPRWSRTFARGIVVILSIMILLGCSIPVAAVTSTSIRVSGASMGLVVSGQTVIEVVASNRSS